MCAAVGKGPGACGSVETERFARGHQAHPERLAHVRQLAAPFEADDAPGAFR